MPQSSGAPQTDEVPVDLPPASLADDSVEPDDDAAATKDVEREQARLRTFVKGLDKDDLTSGNWFAKLLSHALGTYTEKADWQYFSERYKGVPADAVVDQRIKMAARYAAIEGGLSAGAYSGTVLATLGSGGAASPLTLPAALTTMAVDVAYVSQLQLRLAHDIAVLYRVPINISDPEDLWKLIRVSFTIKSGGAVSETAVKAVPAVVRPLVKRYYTKATLDAGRALPVVGKYLLQRNVIKIGIPLVGVPLAAVLNRYTTLVAGRHARAVFRNEARVVELAERLTERTAHPQLLLWVAWLVITADGSISDDEALLMRHLVRLAHERHQVVDDVLANVVEVDRAEVWQRLEAEVGDLADLLDAARQVAEVDGAAGRQERSLLSELAERLGGAQS